MSQDSSGEGTARQEGDCALEENLTSHEVHALSHAFSFADGHAYHEMHEELAVVLRGVGEIWRYCETASIPQLEREFVQAFASLVRSPSLASYPHYSIFPTASNSIDAAAAFLRSRRMKVGLMEPAFDNLYLITKRRELSIVPLPEGVFLNLEALGEIVQAHQLKALLLVNPNNPTGFRIPEAEFKSLCAFARSQGLTIVVDRTFRLYDQDHFDDYEILITSGADFIIFEDTGKTWATQEMKASLMAYSPAIAREMRLIYEEIFLCTSKLSLALLARIISRTQELGVATVLHSEVARRRSVLERALEGSCLKVIPYPERVGLPFLWADVSGSQMTDLEVDEFLRNWDVSVLPGRYFFWASGSTRTQYVRVSLMRPGSVLKEGASRLKSAVASLPSALGCSKDEEVLSRSPLHPGASPPRLLESAA